MSVRLLKKVLSGDSGEALTQADAIWMAEMEPGSVPGRDTAKLFMLYVRTALDEIRRDIRQSALVDTEDLRKDFRYKLGRQETLEDLAELPRDAKSIVDKQTREGDR